MLQPGTSPSWLQHVLGALTAVEVVDVAGLELRERLAYSRTIGQVDLVDERSVLVPVVGVALQGEADRRRVASSSMNGPVPIMSLRMSKPLSVSFGHDHDLPVKLPKPAK